MGAEITIGPIVLLYAKLITQGPIYVPTIILGNKWAPPEARPYIGLTVKYLNMGFFFLLRALGRAIVGLIIGKNGPCMLDDKDGYKSIPIGFDDIKANIASKKEK